MARTRVWVRARGVGLTAGSGNTDVGARAQRERQIPLFHGGKRDKKNGGRAGKTVPAEDMQGRHKMPKTPRGGHRRTGQRNVPGAPARPLPGRPCAPLPAATRALTRRPRAPFPGAPARLYPTSTARPCPPEKDELFSSSFSLKTDLILHNSPNCALCVLSICCKQRVEIHKFQKIP